MTGWGNASAVWVSSCRLLSALLNQSALITLKATPTFMGKAQDKLVCPQMVSRHTSTLYFESIQNTWTATLGLACIFHLAYMHLILPYIACLYHTGMHATRHHFLIITNALTSKLRCRIVRTCSPTSTIYLDNISCTKQRTGIFTATQTKSRKRPITKRTHVQGIGYIRHLSLLPLQEQCIHTHLNQVNHF